MITTNVPEQCRIRLELELIQLNRQLRISQTENARMTDREELHRTQNRFDLVTRAKQRMDEGRYGECLSCHQRIDPERLLVLPTAELCISCQRQLEHATIGRYRTSRLTKTA
jgi:RNA polymerase-binding transcription factor DksA